MTTPTTQQSQFSSTQKTSRVSANSSLQISTKLPCTADLDLGEAPRPNYAPEDIARVQRILLHFVPAELADAIIDLAEYWPYVGASRNDFSTSYSAVEGPDQNAQWCYMVSPKVPSLERNGTRVRTTVKKIKFAIKSYESSWGKSGQTSCPSKGPKTWFEASILKSEESTKMPTYEENARPNDWFSSLASRPKYLNPLRDSNVEPVAHQVENPFDSKRRWHVTNNPESTDGTKWDETVWRHNTIKSVDVDTQTGKGTGSGFFDSLAVDDRIILMTRAMAPGLTNTVFNVKLEVYYGLSSSYL